MRRLTSCWSVLLGAIFVVSGVGKAIDPSDGERAISLWLTSVGGDDAASGTLLRLLVGAEIALGAWLLSGRAARWSLPTTGFVLVGFTGWIISARSVVSTAGCGCSLPAWFGEGVNAAIARNVTLFIGTFVIAALGGARGSPVASHTQEE